ncbi:hypothetical protein [Sanguibacter sp. 25GB23B1]|uniref:hypothetical protein n=1 Tax=unclassified Sanguibacter TaxID=2645534 RepID=UPI0032AECAA1
MTSHPLSQRPTTIRRTIKAALTISLATALGLTACSGDEAPEPTPSASTSTPKDGAPTDPDAAPTEPAAAGDGGAAAEAVEAVQRLLDGTSDPQS